MLLVNPELINPLGETVLHNHGVTPAVLHGLLPRYILSMKQCTSERRLPLSMGVRPCVYLTHGLPFPDQ